MLKTQNWVEKLYLILVQENLEHPHLYDASRCCFIVIDGIWHLMFDDRRVHQDGSVLMKIMHISKMTSFKLGSSCRPAQ